MYGDGAESKKDGRAEKIENKFEMRSKMLSE